jgi:negative regulator of sigma-B (phosphoserine phosphatase)
VATLPGYSASGDCHIVMPTRTGTLVAVMDGVGHGNDAAAAATMASSILGSFAEEPLIAIMRRCHAGLRGTRGVTMSMASIDFRNALMTWLGVGNVQGILLKSDTAVSREEESLLLRQGIVGGSLPTLHAAVLPVAQGDTLIFATDGIRSEFDRPIGRSQAPQTAAQTILDKYAKGIDDALVFVARFLGKRE